MVRVALLDLPELAHGFSGELRNPLEHERFASEVDAGTLPRVRLRQVHGARVVAVDDRFDFAAAHEGDALVTTRAGVALTIAHADCVPLLLADLGAGVIGAAHAGWRGMHARVVLRAVEAMVALGALPSRIRAAIGPAVRSSCYVVGEDVRTAYRESFPDADSLFEDDRLDLHAAARAELARAGLSGIHVYTAARCTHCEPGLASHRRQGRDRGTNVALIAMRTPTPPATHITASGSP